MQPAVLSCDTVSCDTVSCDALSCESHDYLEIVCMFHYMLKVMDKNGQVFKGKASDVRIDDENTEVLVLQEIASEMHIPTIEIASINVLTPNARFQKIMF